MTEEAYLDLAAILFFGVSHVVAFGTILRLWLWVTLKSNPEFARFIARLILGWGAVYVSGATAYWFYLHGQGWVLFPMGCVFFAVGMNNVKMMR